MEAIMLVQSMLLQSILGQIFQISTREYKNRCRVIFRFWKCLGVDYDKTLDESNKLRSSTGINASWNSPLGPMTFVLSTNLSKASTDRTESFNFNGNNFLMMI